MRRRVEILAARSCSWGMVLVTGLLVVTAGVPAAAQTLKVRVVSTGGVATVYAWNEENVQVMVQVLLEGAPTDGLAFFSTDLSATGGYDLCDQYEFLLMAPASLAPHFDRNGGLTNPPGLPLSGFSGTCDGAGGLIQIGGAQNTIGNTGTPVVFPSGTVLTGVGNGGWTTIASGLLTTPAAGSFTSVVAAHTVRASTINPGQTGPVYHVTPVASANITIAGSLEIVIGCTGPVFGDADVNCDGIVNAGDLLSVRAPGTWQRTGEPGFIRADVNNDGAVNAGDLLSIRAPGTWQTSGAGSGCGCN